MPSRVKFASTLVSISNRVADALMGLLPRRAFARAVVNSLLCIACFSAGYLLARKNISVGADKSVVEQKSKTTFLVVLIVSAPDNAERRRTIRQTWLSADTAKGEDVSYYFVVGARDLSDKARIALTEESVINGQDLLLLPTVVDKFTELTEKVLTAMTMLYHQVDFRYLLKVDDDSFVRVDSIVDELKNANYASGLYWGFFDGRAPVHRNKNSKWYEENSYELCDRYVPYALGGGYILSVDLVQYLAENSRRLRRFANEDVSVGTWLAGLGGLHRVHDERFDTEFRSRGCSNSYLVTHKQSPQAMLEKMASLTTAGLLCRRGEVVTRESYAYNWQNPPSKCCNRNWNQ